MSSARGFTFLHSKKAKPLLQFPNSGFTLIELMVVVSIIAVLSLVGMTVYTGVQKSARDARRRADIDAISKAYEIRKGAGYLPLNENTDFSSGVKPQDPTKGDYFNWLASDGSGYKVCASLEANPSTSCNTPAQNCYCLFSAQSNINSSSTYDSSSTQYTLGLGGSTQSSCDSNGILAAGLVGYWKMDETTNWNSTPGEVKDWTGVNNGTAFAGVGITTGQPGFGNAGNFVGNGYLNFGNIPNYTFDPNKPFSISFWINSNSSSDMRIAAKSRSADGRGWNLYYFASTLRLRFHIVDTWPTIARVRDVTNFNVVDGTWHLVAITYDGTGNTNGVNSIRVYKDGTEVSSASYATYNQNGTLNSIDSQGSACLGKECDVSSDSFPVAIIDDLRIYNRALTPTEISLLASKCVSP